MKYKYHCWNNECRAYCGQGHLIESWVPLKTCPHCGQYLEDCSDGSAWYYPILFMASGAVIGLMLGEWLGMAKGVVIGAILYVLSNRKG